jgi:aspartokinase
MDQHTKFEKPRGVSKISIRHGYAQVHLSGWGKERASQRLEAVRSLTKAGISVDFVKLTPSGMSFLVRDDLSDALRRVLNQMDVHHSIRRPCSMVTAHAVNIRDEEGLVARIMKAAIDGGFQVHHISDMHDRALLVVDTGEAEQLAAHLESELQAVTHEN